MGIMSRLFKHEEETIDPQAVALDATVADLRRVSSELQQTSAAFKQQLKVLKENPSDRP